MLGQSAHPRPIFAVVVKSPCLAVKYPTGNGYVSNTHLTVEPSSHAVKIRRFQLKFSSDREFYTALAILSDIRCPFSESNVGSSQLARRPTSSQWHSRSGPSSLGIRDPFPSSASAALFPVLPSASALGSASSINAAQATAPDPSGTGSTNSYTELEAKQPQRTIQPHTEEEPRPNAASVPPKPSTTAACHDITILSQLLPPKRELPFSKPPAKRSRTTPKEPSTSTQSQTLSAGDQIPTTTGNDAATAAPPSSQAPGTKKPTPKRKTATTGVLKRSITSVPPLTLAEEPPTQPIQSISSLAQPATIPGTQQVHIYGQNPDFESSNNIGHWREQQDPTPADLSSYLSAPTQERTARLENWICQNLENDGFIKLCQDVEGIWRRIAFGS
ncbi:uncharacterized protein NFIA_053470 [Aspergillus fischeri NRRL 181]|uniref:Uncharacterized protein n=1 Tax=Neosartorya fischeri (strain ATCC 1020 / DSM 3700 / CBS 544.65 / FGSC A1164 / JCM 1740 / NRRL 181 / WB 181) TaxID=331117 RepID=A1DMI0_NEOFI|nr:uncharacterized protein NFIA_053470 [Aspergillus fischeri NRRL 181]EAW16001.1 hypothetical protein NFIA_053470 [Aspergillus fischeri NRRL 181]